MCKFQGFSFMWECQTEPAIRLCDKMKSPCQQNNSKALLFGIEMNRNWMTEDCFSDEHGITSSLSDLVREVCFESEEEDDEDIPVFVETLHFPDTDDELKEKEENNDRLQPLPSFNRGNVKLKRTSSKPVAGMVRDRLKIFAEPEASAPTNSPQEKKKSVGEKNKDFMKYERVEEKQRHYKRASTKPAPGTVKNLSKKFEQGSGI